MNKYIDETGEMLNDIAMDGFLDDQCGSVTEDGIWFGLILEHKAIISEDSQGFFSYEMFETEQETRDRFNQYQSFPFVECLEELESEVIA